MKPTSTTTTMVKKILSGGAPCRKCGQAEDMLRTRGLWDQITRVAVAEEDDESSEGMRLARRFGVETAPFFIVEVTGQEPVVFTSAIKFAKFLAANAAESGGPVDDSPVEQIAHQLKDAEPQEIIRHALTRYGTRCAISFSGAEDVVLIDMATRLGLPFAVFSLDTGRIAPETYRFIDKVRTRYGVEIEMVSPDPKLLQPFVRQKGLFSFYEDGHQQCCSIRKVEPLRRFLAGYAAQITGQRRDQSVTRVSLSVAQQDPTLTGSDGAIIKFNPLAGWTSATVWAYIRDFDVPYNELHDRGYVSIGCEPCTRPPRPSEHERAGRWWWEEETQRECGLHVKK